MSLYAYDVNGYLGDVASGAGWAALAATLRLLGTQELVAFLDAGETREPDAFADALARAHAADPAVEATRANLEALARRANAVLIVSDGLGNEVGAWDGGVRAVPAQPLVFVQDDAERPRSAKDLAELALGECGERLGIATLEVVRAVSGDRWYVEGEFAGGKAFVTKSVLTPSVEALSAQQWRTACCAVLEEARQGEHAYVYESDVWAVVEGADVYVPPDAEEFTVPDDAALRKEVDYAAIEREWDALDVQGVEKLGAALRAAAQRLAKTISAKGADLAALVKKPKLFDAPEIGEAAEALLRRAWDAGRGRARKELAQWGEAKKFAAPTFTPRAAASWLSAKQFYITDVLDQRLTEAARAVLVNGLKIGKPGTVLAAELLAALAPYVGGKVGEEVVMPHRLETIVRTNVNEAYNHGRLTAILADDAQGLIVGVRYSAILDERTCFARGTAVHTREGTRPIESLRPGDIVFSGARKLRRVKALKIALARRWVGVALEDGSYVKATSTHPFWAIRAGSSGWVEGAALTCGDKIGTVHVRAVREPVPGVRMPAAEVLLMDVSSEEKADQHVCAADVSVLQEGIHGASHLCGTRGQRRDVLLGAVHAHVSAAGCAARGDHSTVRCVQETFSDSTQHGTEGRAAFSLLTGVQKAQGQGEMLDVWQGDRDERDGACEILLGLVLPTIGGRDTAGSRCADGTGEPRLAFSAGSSSRSLFARLLGGAEVGDRDQRSILASENGRERVDEEAQRNCCCGAQADYSECGSCGRHAAVEPFACADHSVRPEPTGEVVVRSVEEMIGWQVCYDLEIEADHSYLVGDAGLIAHNTEVCRFLHGKVFEPDNPDLEALLPPNHFQCRSLIVPIGVSSKVGVDEWITEAEIEEARGKADASFLVETREAWRAYREGAAN